MVFIATRNAQTVEKTAVHQAILEAYPFTVDKFPLAGPDGMKTDIYACFRSDNSKMVGNKSVKSRYVPHTTEHVADVCQAAAYAFGEDVKMTTNFRHGHIVNITPVKTEMLELNKREQLIPMMMLRASFDGRSFIMNLGLNNPLCTNLEIFESVKECQANIRHTSAIDFRMENLVKKLSALRESWVTIETFIEHMNGNSTHIDDFIAELFKKTDSKKGESMYNKRRDAIKDRIRDEQIATGEQVSSYATNWRLYNGIQGYFQHDAIRREGTTEIERILSANTGDTVRAFQLLSA